MNYSDILNNQNVTHSGNWAKIYNSLIVVSRCLKKYFPCWWDHVIYIPDINLQQNDALYGVLHHRGCLTT